MLSPPLNILIEESYIDLLDVFGSEGMGHTGTDEMITITMDSHHTMTAVFHEYQGLIAGSIIISGNSRYEANETGVAYVQIEIALNSPSTADLDNMIITLSDHQVEETVIGEWILLQDGLVASGSRLMIYFYGLEGGESIRGTKITIGIHGYMGDLSRTIT
ncbi:MAG: hypothetical protein R6U17_01660 [Thermoplasmata archaeon]